MQGLFASIFSLPSVASAEDPSWAFASIVNDFAGYDGLYLEDESRRSLLADLERIYSEPHRAYHNRRHIVEAGRWLKRFSWPAKGPARAAVSCTLLFHDAVYDPKRSDNEERSADLAAEMLRPLKQKTRSFIDETIPAERVVEAARPIILATKRHVSTHSGANSACNVVLDADLSILAAPEERYDEYTRAIRREYDFVADDAFVAGRSKMLRAFLERDWLFHSMPGRRELEGLARKNIRRELSTMRGR